MNLPSKTDYLVIGTGIAGLNFALKAAKYGKVLVVTKSSRYNSASSFAQGGIAAAIGNMDMPENHREDTLEAGAGLCDIQAVNILVNEGLEKIKNLIAEGMQFTKDHAGNLHLGREGGHKQHRVLHVHDYTGKGLRDYLLALVKKESNIEIIEDVMAIDLITEHHISPEKTLKHRTCFGAYLLDEATGNISAVVASFTCLATGGAGRVYPITTNPDVSTGDGIAMAYRAGCRIRNMEFFQFHPTALYSKADPAFLISEALRGFGAYLTDSQGQRFMQKYDPRNELAPRDIVTRAIDTELKTNGVNCVYLDIRHKSKEEIMHHFPSIYEALTSTFNIDMSSDLIPVVPAAHYLCGGVMVDYNSRTDLKYLYAVGETASTGVHGGNRLASNSLLEAFVFSDRAAIDSIRFKARQTEDHVPHWDTRRAMKLKERILLEHDQKEIQQLMWDYVGIVRSETRLKRALARIDVIYSDIKNLFKEVIPEKDFLELRNLVLVAQLITRSAFSRKESRGLHFMMEYPEHREPNREDTILTPGIYTQSTWED